MFTGHDIMRSLGFIWLGDLLRFKANTVAYVAPYQLVKLDDAGEAVRDEDGKKVMVEYWKAHDKHGLKISDYLISRREATDAAENWVAKEHSLLISVALELATLKKPRITSAKKPSERLNIRVEKRGPSSFSADLTALSGSPSIGFGRSVGEAIGVLVQCHSARMNINLDLSDEAAEADGKRWIRYYHKNR